MRSIYQRLFDSYGPQHWWPADSPFEVMVGAVLTQNTAWRNVERAIDNLRQQRLLELEAMAVQSAEALAERIRPAGYYNIKARRLLNLCRMLQHHGGISGLEAESTAELRRLLLGVNGVGPETADDILLYAFQRPVFVIDAYTRRIFSRLGLIRGDESYEQLRRQFESTLDADAVLYNEYHALIVRHAKQHCGRRPQCAGCSLGKICISPEGSTDP